MFERFTVIVVDTTAGRGTVCRQATAGGTAECEHFWFDTTNPCNIGFEAETRQFRYQEASPATKGRIPQIGTVLVGSIAYKPDPVAGPFLMNWGYADQYDEVEARARQELPVTGFPLWSLLMQLHAIDLAKAVHIARAFDKLDDGGPVTEEMSIAIGEARQYLYSGDYFPYCSFCNHWVFPDTTGHAELVEDEPKCYNCYDHGCEECKPDSICTTCYRWGYPLQDGVCAACIEYPGECTNCRGNNGGGCPVCRPWRWYVTRVLVWVVEL